MKSPQLRAEVMILNEDRSKVIVQCDLSETFYRFPGGSIEFGETAKEVIIRELMEEYDLKIDVQGLALVNEHIFEWNNEKGHHCTLIHWGTVQERITNEIRHKEYEDIKLTWKSINELMEKPTYPKGILSYLEEDNRNIVHFISKNI
ncbi:NUDIX domain-containing protein [Bacillus albus]|uniref:NUDIX domain-containing protein n=1 Tax=Bacillus TaxID=1386 RepID=UPI0022E5A7FD|nr:MULTISPECIES: NUDIX domain-containing protein [Bacillus cereus group]MDA2025803.1 NUDIX domain-containing protein [Bacillus cereus group sp. Bcc03]MDA2215581.1 NUDIX domain-containing protein [Bacillus cereus group sp. Bc228]MDA2226044.1 NUDIX domain-containing protein [Bacillus cereus group sp. Bc227]MDA2259908.1 NUDIX domain-containing protein [Bacillus cereus group sp. Bc200]MDA2320445.1 NUDIX domain-containing protein [Bacillus cereus group sp. Bc177]